MTQPVAILWCLLLTAISEITMVRIERLNVAAGGFLPRNIKFNAHHNPKWRVAPVKMIRESMELDIRGTDVDRPLTVEEQARIEAAVERGQGRNDLRELVETWGLLQYLVAPLALLCTGGILMLGRGVLARSICGACALLSAMAIVAMFHRDYFGSLGW